MKDKTDKLRIYAIIRVNYGVSKVNYWAPGKQPEKEPDIKTLILSMIQLFVLPTFLFRFYMSLFSIIFYIYLDASQDDNTLFSITLLSRLK